MLVDFFENVLVEKVAINASKMPYQALILLKSHSTGFGCTRYAKLVLDNSQKVKSMRIQTSQNLEKSPPLIFMMRFWAHLGPKNAKKMLVDFLENVLVEKVALNASKMC